ncbi:MAG: long-chain fatty acid--CoA ligase, partial [Nevskiales bacterium]
HEGYAMSENTAYAFINHPGKARFGSVGQALPGSEVKIADDGEILTRSPATMVGYYKQPDKTAETIDADGWLHTGDRGRLDEDGYLFITGRVKDIFKTIKGKYVAPAPIEGKFASNSDIESLCMVGAGLKQPVLLVSLSEEGQHKSREEIETGLLASLKAVNASLEAHELIDSIGICAQPWTIDNGLLTPTMKIKRNVVEEQYQQLVEQCVAAGRGKLIWE